MKETSPWKIWIIWPSYYGKVKVLIESRLFLDAF